MNKKLLLVAPVLLMTATLASCSGGDKVTKDQYNLAIYSILYGKNLKMSATDLRYQYDEEGKATTKTFTSLYLRNNNKEKIEEGSTNGRSSSEYVYFDSSTMRYYEVEELKTSDGKSAMAKVDRTSESIFNDWFVEYFTDLFDYDVLSYKDGKYVYKHEFSALPSRAFDDNVPGYMKYELTFKDGKPTQAATDVVALITDKTGTTKEYPVEKISCAFDFTYNEEPFGEVGDAMFNWENTETSLESNVRTVLIDIVDSVEKPIKENKFLYQNAIELTVESSSGVTGEVSIVNDKSGNKQIKLVLDESKATQTYYNAQITIHDNYFYYGYFTVGEL